MVKIPEAKPELIGEYTNLKDLRKKIQNFLFSKFTNKKIINSETKYEVGFDKTGIKKLTSESGIIKLKCLTAIKEIIETGTLFAVEDDKEKRKDILVWYKFKTKIKVNDSIYEYRFSVRQLKGDKIIYSANIDVKKPL
ncbi:MAG: hypothetical protein IIA88_01285 [Bacteroidetes bacterium]|nr:hypothetical protein [Bacteroidota bacterium]